jgi:hypothetical protein
MSNFGRNLFELFQRKREGMEKGKKDGRKEIRK